MNKKIILNCNYDGSYRLGSNDVPRPSDVEAVRRFRKNGGVFGIVTDRDVYEIMAVLSVLKNEYDYIVCSCGAAAFAKADLISSGTSSENILPTRLYSHYMNPHLVFSIAEILESAGVSLVTVDTADFMGGDSMAQEFGRQHAAKGGTGYIIHRWQNGHCFRDVVEKDALRFIFPVTKMFATFKNSLTTDSVVSIIKEKYSHKVAIHRNGKGFDITVPEANKVYGVRRVLEAMGASDENVWYFGDSPKDIGGLKEFKGIALASAGADVACAASFTAANVEEAIEVVMAEM